MIVTEAVRLDSQNGANGFPDSLAYNSLLFSRRSCVDPASPATRRTDCLLIFKRGENALRKGIFLHASKELTPFFPINPNQNRLGASRTKERLKQRHRFTGGNCICSLPGKEIGDTLVARDKAFAAEYAPVDSKRGKAERLTMVRQAVEKSVRGTVISLSGITKNA